MKRSVFLIITLLVMVAMPQNVFADDEEPDVRDMKTRERIFVGGSMGLQFGTITVVNISPIVGYRITNRLSAGLGGTYQYYNDRSFGQSFSTNMYGGNVFARFLVIPQAFLHAEAERLSLESFRFDPGSDRTRVWEENYFLGAGYRARLGAKTYFNIMMLYNFNPDSQVYYQNPIFRFGIDIGL
jgi:hypothetical protein